jgi:phosphoribosylamine--glycine ligase
MMRIKSDLLELLLATVEGRLSDCSIEVDERSAACVVMASPGYPGSYAKGKQIFGLEAAAEVPDCVVFHAGTAIRGGRTVTAGGRVLGVTALGEGVNQAVERAYQATGRIEFEDGAQFRRDIAHRALKPATGRQGA